MIFCNLISNCTEMTEEGSLNPHETWTASSDDQLLASIVNLLEDWSPDSQLSQSSLYETNLFSFIYKCCNLCVH